MLKTKTDLNEGSDDIIAILGLCLFFNYLVMIWIEKEVCLKLNVQGQRSGRIFKVDGVGRPEN